MKRSGNKYNAKKTVVDGMKFDSQAEARHWLLLKQMEKDGEITGLERQKRLSLDVNGVHICDVVIDFAYWIPGERRVFADKKGYINKASPATRLWMTKYKLVEAIYKVPVTIV